MFQKLLFLVIGIVGFSSVSFSQEKEANDLLMKHVQSLQAQNQPIPNYFLGKIITQTDTKQPTSFQTRYGNPSPLASLGAIAFVVGLIGALSDPANSNSWWTVCLIGLFVYLLF